MQMNCDARCRNSSRVAGKALAFDNAYGLSDHYYYYWYSLEDYTPGHSIRNPADKTKSKAGG